MAAVIARPQQGMMLERIVAMAWHFWRGRYSLGVSFWLFGVAVMLVLWSLGFLMVSLHESPSLLEIAVAATILAPWQVLCSVGIWRSASRYTGKRGYALAAKILVAVYAAQALYGVGLAVYIAFLATALAL